MCSLPIWNQSIVPCLVLLLLDLHTDFQKADKAVWYSDFFKNFSVCCDPHRDFGVVSEAEVDVLLEFSCFFYDPMDIGNLISGFSAFSESSLNIWRFSVHILLKPSLENFEHYFAIM